MKIAEIFFHRALLSSSGPLTLRGWRGIGVLFTSNAWSFYTWRESIDSNWHGELKHQQSSAILQSICVGYVLRE